MKLFFVSLSRTSPRMSCGNFPSTADVLQCSRITGIILTCQQLTSIKSFFRCYNNITYTLYYISYYKFTWK